MAEGTLSHIAGRLVQQLGSPVMKEIGRAWGVKGEIKRLGRTVSSIKAVLRDAEEKHGKNNNEVTEWLLQLKEVVYDADDLLDDFATELKKREVMTGNRMAKKVRIFFFKSNQLAYGLNMGHKIKDIREELDAIQNNRKFHLDENPVQNVERRQTHSYVPADDVIGRDEDKNAIIQNLLDSHEVENVSVIPIFGIGGLGKTTLAQYVYNDEKVKNHFQLRIWVYVSEVFDVKIIIKDIIKNIIISANDKDTEKLEKLNVEDLRELLSRKIDGKKYLLVLDDIWNENREDWLKLERLLINGIKGSKILITTRSKRVAEITSTLPFPELKGLNEDQSWSLFKKMAFKNETEPIGSKLVEIGKCIAKKCVGVPLAIKIIGCLLYGNYTEDNWLHFKENELSQINDRGEIDILPTLKLSYDHLPSELKQCFAYCALFPKDHKIEKDYLVDLWMAQGFLWSSSANQSPEVVGNEYFTNLLSRSFFQDVERDDWDNVISCKMHDLMHELATKVAGSECSLLKIDATICQAKTRHISFDSKLDFSWNIPTDLLEKSHIRTFLLPIPYFYGNKVLNESNFNKILSSFRCLRTLDLIRSDIKKLPNSIGKLKHLRYLDVSHNKNIIKLPNSMIRLKNLQILKLNCCSSLKELPKDLRKMVSLRCLMMENCESLNGIPSGLRLLTNLRTLSTFVVGSKSRKYVELLELDELNNLSSGLEIRGLKNVRSKDTLANLEGKNNLKSLALLWDSTYSSAGWSHDVVSFNEEVLESLQPHPSLKALSIKSFMGMRISSWLSSLTSLTSIEISHCRRCQHIPRLDQLPSLQRLFLQDLNDLEYMISENGSNDSSSTTSTSFFPSLKQLRIWQCGNLKGWYRDVDNDNDDGAMKLSSFPCLSQLHIGGCPSLTCMPLYRSLEEQTMKLKNIVTPSTSSTDSASFSKLNSLYITNCKNLDFLTNVDDKWKEFTSLNTITFYVIRELVSLPQGLQHVPNLQKLRIWDCPKLMDLPEGMQLQVLEIAACPKLMENCPQLSERCGNNKGIDWPKISHIPNIRIDGKWIKKEGYKLNAEGSSSH